MTKRLAFAAAVLVMAMTCGCSWWAQRQIYKQAGQMTGGDPERGRIEMQRYACAGCHTIPGLPNVPATGVTKGPSLEHWYSRKTIAGKLPNTPQNLIRWIQQPNAISPGTQMPEMGISQRKARDIAAYLYTLR